MRYYFRLISIIVFRNLKLVYKFRRESDCYLRVGLDFKELLLGLFGIN